MEERGAGIRLRAQGVKVRAIRAAIKTLLSSTSHRQAAGRVAEEFARWSAPERFASMLDQVTASTSAESERNAR